MELRRTALFGDTNLKAYYRLNFDNILKDSKGNFTLTNNGAATAINAKFYGGANLNSGKYLNNGSAYGVTNTTVSLGCWVKILSEPASGVIQGVIALKFSDNDTTVYIWYENNAGTKSLAYYRDKNGISRQGASYTVNMGTTSWHHLVVTYDGTNVRGYYDATLVAGPAAASGAGNNGLTDGFTLGANSSGGNTINAIVDDAFVFNKVLSLAEIQTLYKNGYNGGGTIFELL